MKLKIGYFADGKWSHISFERLIKDEQIQIKFICVRFDTSDKTLYNYAKKYDIPYLKHQNINSDEFIAVLEKFQCDLFVSMSFNQIFKEKTINLPRYKTINCHAGKLPFYRGRNILNWALINDEREFGITAHYVDTGIDTGDILVQKCYEINDDDTYASLLERAYVGCADVLCEAINLFKNGAPKGKSQSEINAVGFYCTQRKSGDERLNFNQSSRDVFNFVRAISKPAVMARAMLNGYEMSINKVELIPNAPIYKGIAGAILAKDENGFLVKTADSFVRVVQWEFEGKFKIGDRFE